MHHTITLTLFPSTGHVLYHCTTISEGSDTHILFTGDTLFLGGVGAFFEGDAAGMTAIIKKVIERVPPSTMMYCGHEYALNFLPNAANLDKGNERLRERLAWAQR